MLAQEGFFIKAITLNYLPGQQIERKKTDLCYDKYTPQELYFLCLLFTTTHALATYNALASICFLRQSDFLLYGASSTFKTDISE